LLIKLQMPRESVLPLVPLKSVASNILYTLYGYGMRSVASPVTKRLGRKQPVSR
jgi:hypothetical protein